MRVFVESNFLLTLFLQQGGFEACDGIVELAERKQIQLIVPSFSMAELYQSLGEKHRRRSELSNRLSYELSQIQRSAYSPTNIEQDYINKGTGLVRLLSLSASTDLRQTESGIDRISGVAELIPFSAGVIQRSKQCRETFLLDKLGDAAICASILEYLDATEQSPSLFVENDREDFSNPDLVEAFRSLGCEIEYQFDTALRKLSAL